RLNQIAVSDRATLGDVSQFCDNELATARNSLILNGEMSEWFKEHAWKSDLFTRADAHQIPPTHSRSTTSRNINTRRGVPVNHRVDRGFGGVCDTFLTKNRCCLGWTSRTVCISVCLTSHRGSSNGRM